MLRLAVCAMVLGALLGCSTADRAPMSEPVTPANEARLLEAATGRSPSADAAMLVFHRADRLVGSSNVYSVWIGEERIGLLPDQTHLVHEVASGTVSIRLKTVPNIFNIGLGVLVMRTGPIDVQVDAGRSHYFEVSINQLTGGPAIEQVDAERAIPLLYQTRRSEGVGDGAVEAREPGLLVPLRLADDAVPAAVVPGRRLVFAEPVDARTETGRMGERFAAFGVSMGNVYASRSVPDFLQDAVAGRLADLGHEITTDPPGVLLVLEVERFWFDTDTTAFHWDVNGEVAIQLALADSEAGPPLTGRFSCSVTERTYTPPQAALFAGLVERCMADLMDNVAGWEALRPAALAAGNG